MAIRRRASIKKRRQDKKRHLHNIVVRNELKKAIKKFQALVAEKNVTEAKTLIQQVFSKLDKAAKKGIIHKRHADRKKSRLAKQLLKKA
ncbi:MAG: 30S ribosomal protein S20 [Candidatus Omnitrophica bacterium]|nr:30S ribosomal protein S20 [Candidatus Omnitrophota bacterium]MDD5610801.1 30S ribosomal protein S20 [Candidatus Omnitrophota bacterium]